MHPPLTLHKHPMCAEGDWLPCNLQSALPCFCSPQWNREETPKLLMCLLKILNIIEQFQKCHIEHPIKKFFGECTDLKIKLDRCFREEKALKRKANFEDSKKFKEQLRAFRKENATNSGV